MTSLTRKTALALTAALTLFVAGCADQGAFEDNSSKVTLKHRIPSK